VEKKEMQTVRKAWYAGTWYSAEASVLQGTVDQAIQAAGAVGKPDSPLLPYARFAVLPHAGLTYSARGIAHFFTHVSPDLQRVVVLAPSHYAHLAVDRFTTAHYDAFETPLGSLGAFDLFPTDYQRFEEHPAAVQREHAVEMVLPFIAAMQRQLGHRIQVSMALISEVSSPQAIQQLAGDVLEYLGREALEGGTTAVIASSDFTHYGQRFGYAPFGIAVNQDVVDQVRVHDLELAQRLCASQLGPILLEKRQHGTTVCGLAAASVVAALAGSLSSKGGVADYYTSRDVMGDDATDFVAYCTILWR